MGTLQQQSILQGQHTGRNQKKDLVHELFSHAAKSHPNQIAIYYEGKTFLDIKYNKKIHQRSGLKYDYNRSLTNQLY